ncbi:hypothetical protein ACH47Z_38290 [Streptomyces sp. NPDC020192]|uniref:hypothetical protein n=1 Tax=Streptomyces sp. NPDC020192 TaxID=3365066 RepID=UPI0037A9B06D
MAQAVLALGAATVTAAGCVWYLPALADLRAGSDRPVSHRRAAAACLSGWATLGVVAVLLLVSEAWWAPTVAAGVGAAVTLDLRVRAAVQRRREQRETARHWSELREDQRSPRDSRARMIIVALLIGFGLALAVAVDAAWAIAEPEEKTGGWVVAAGATTIVGLFLIVAAVSGRVPRRHRDDVKGHFRRQSG